LTADNECFVCWFCGELWNCELIDLAVGRDITKLNALDRVEFLAKAHEGFVSSAEVEFCALHFFEFDRSRLKDLPLNIFEAIVSQDCLPVETEDSLYEIIQNRFSSDFGFSSLLRFVRFEYLSIELIGLFCKMIGNSFDVLTPDIFCAISRRFLLPVYPSIGNARSIISETIEKVVWGSIKCPFHADHPLDGIIRYLTPICESHVHDRGIVLISESSCYGSGWESRYIADLEGKDRRWFASKHLPDSCVSYDFKTQRIKLTHYIIRSRFDYNSGHLMSWIFEGLLDGETWIALDRPENNESLMGLGKMGSFSILTCGPVRHLRVRQTGKNSDNSDYIHMSALEIFGVLLEPQ
jgi:hypothetical protein